MDNNNQAKLLLDHIKERKSQPRTREQALFTLVSAGILTKDGNFTEHFSILNKIVTTDK